ncbi:MAG TPA: hypothetical protein VHO84_15765 [Syntrophorhabdaceae bacterium]|nr:hypothetical protein [Syntrophorhabdaceae bacterium]
MDRSKGKAALLISASLLVGLIILTFVLNALPATHWAKSAVFEPHQLLPITNSIFLALIPFIVAYLLMRSYMLSGAPALPYFGEGMLVLGIGSLLSGWLMYPYGPNVSVTIFNVAVLIMAMFHVTGIIMRLIDRSTEPNSFDVVYNCSPSVEASLYVWVCLLLLRSRALRLSSLFRGLDPRP